MRQLIIRVPLPDDYPALDDLDDGVTYEIEEDVEESDEDTPDDDGEDDDGEDDDGEDDDAEDDR